MLGRWQGHADSPLSELGLRQARAGAEVAGAFDLIASSDLGRAVQTAEIIANASGIGPVLTDIDLRERNAGAWQGMTKPEIEIDYPGFLSDGRRPDGYEGDDSVRLRVLAGLARISGIVGEGEALVVVHAGVIYAMEEMTGLPFKRISNLGGRYFEMTPDNFVAGDRVLLANPNKVETTTPEQI